MIHCNEGWRKGQTEAEEGCAGEEAVGGVGVLAAHADEQAQSDSEHTHTEAARDHPLAPDAVASLRLAAVFMHAVYLPCSVAQHSDGPAAVQLWAPAQPEAWGTAASKTERPTGSKPYPL
eukprot:3935375-Rhodomonas_salina.3